MNIRSLSILFFLAASTAFGQWPGFRGNGDSQTAQSGLPTQWGDDSNVAWRCGTAGYGQSSPIIWEQSVFVTSASGEKKENLHLQAFSSLDGSEQWSKTFEASNTPEEVSDMISRGAPTPAADGERVYAFYESGDLFAVDHEGELIWKRHLVEEYGEFKGGHGIGSSVVLTEKAVVILIDHDGPSYLLAIDKATGKNLWKSDRTARVSWTTPLYTVYDGIPQIVVSSNGSVDGYHAETGDQIWTVTGVDMNTVASPTRFEDVIYIGASTPKNCMAIKLGGKGDVTDSHVLWRADGVTSSFGSPLVVGDFVFFVNRAGVIQALNRGDGKLVWQSRLPASTWASAINAHGVVYAFCKDGQSMVLKPNAEGPNEVSINTLSLGGEKDRIYGVAVSGNQFIVRLENQIIALSDN
ncbi:MAG: PQQ-binding-like beta-propeller repeat protein, partial [Verrucomicrobiota bacterium]